MRAVQRRAGLLVVGLVVRSVRRVAAEWDEIVALPEDERSSWLENLHSELRDDYLLDVAASLRHRYLFCGRGEPEFDVKVAARLAELTWYRYMYLPERISVDELVFAFTLFPKIYARKPGWVPAMIAPLFSPTPAPAAGRYGHDLDALIAGARDLIDYAKERDDNGEDGGECRRYAIGLARGAMALAGRLRWVDPGVRTELAGALAAAYADAEDADDDLLVQALACARTAVTQTPAYAEERLHRLTLLTAITGMAIDILHDDSEDTLRAALGWLAAAIKHSPRTHPDLTSAAKTLIFTLIDGWDHGLQITPRAETRQALDLIPNDDPDRDEITDALRTEARHAWEEYVSAPDEVPERDLAFAVLLYGWLRSVDPGQVPGILLPLYDPDAPESARGEDDVWLLASCARDLFVHAADLPASEHRSAAEYRAHAAALAHRARALSGRLRELRPDVQARLAWALLRLFDHTRDAGLLDEADELATSCADATVLAYVRWYRYRFRPEEGGRELAIVISLFERLHVADPELVPDGLRALFEPGFEMSDDADVEDMMALAAWADDLFTYAETHQSHVPAAVTLAGQALELGSRLGDLDPGSRAELARVLLSWFEHTKEDAVLDRAVAEARTAVSQTPADDEERVDRLVILGLALAEVADARKDPDSLREAIDLLRPAIHAARPEQPRAVQAVLGLVRAVTLRGAWNTGRTVTAETARELRSLLDLVPEDNPGWKYIDLAVLGAEMVHLFQLGDYSGARERRHAIDRRLEDFPPGEPLRDTYRLNSAGFLVLERMLANDPALDRVIAGYRNIFHRVGATLDPLDRATQLDWMTTMMLDAEAMTGLPGVADECAALLEDGMESIPRDSDEYSALSAQLGSVLTHRFRTSADRADLDRGIALLRSRQLDLADRRVETTDPNDRFLAAESLGEALREQYRLTGDERSYREAMALLRSAASDPEHLSLGRIKSAITAGQLAGEAGNWDDAVTVLADAVALSAASAWRGLDRPDQELSLAVWSGTVNEAAAAAIRAGHPLRAVELFEQGRAVLFHHMLDVRSDAARLGVRFPELAARLGEIQQELDRVRDRTRRLDLAREWDRLVAYIRSRPGFEEFLRAPRFTALRPADGQTVAVVNAAEFGSDALLVTRTGVRVVPLPELTTGDVMERVTTFQQALDDYVGTTGRAGWHAASAAIADVLDWLWRTSAKPILDAMGHTRAPRPGRPWPHVHWCPTWMLTFLPFHAAAARDPAAPGDAVLDRVISSYASSLRTLRSATERADPPPDRRSLLVISMPETPGLPPLPGARQEAAGLSGLSVRTATLAGDQAVRAAVSRALGEHTWAHFACHAAQDLQNPSRGRIFLYDHQTHPFTVRDISLMHLEHARLAFLSACDTARGGLRLPDEALHLGGAMQLAGYEHVIATLWPVKDVIAARVTAQVYDRMSTSDATLDPARAPFALHEAMRNLRDRYPGDPLLWAGYVHFGP